MRDIKPPKYVRQVLITLQSRGYAAYLVGGCVRDMLLSTVPNDWDVCTSALPEQVLALFPDAKPTGLRHGTVTVTIGSRAVEVTTFRSEGSYADHRHPDTVSFVGDLAADLSRRDFTMNAIALSADGLLSDPFGGVEDIRNRRIRCVGVPEERFEEDALRMLRALRFSARLGFTIDLITLDAIREKAPLAAFLAPERVEEELEKILLTDSPETVCELMDLGLLDAFLLRRPRDTAPFSVLRALPRRRPDRWAALSILLERAGCIESPRDFLRALRQDNRLTLCCTNTAQILRSPPPETAAAWKRLLQRYGVDTVTVAARCSDAMAGGKTEQALRAVIKSGECFSLQHLAVTGDDLLSLGLKGREVGDMLRFLLDYVIEYPANNRRELLLSLASRDTED